MKEYVKIAWRNLWRNRRRTLITVASIFFALLLALFMRSMQLGSYDEMLENAVRTSTGYIQIHAKGYWEEKSINNTFVMTDELIEALEGSENISHYVPRLESFTLCSFDNHTRDTYEDDKTKGAMLIGIDPSAEHKLSGLANKIAAGEYLEKSDHSVIVGEGLAEFLGIIPTVNEGASLGSEAIRNDTLALWSQGYQGQSATGLFNVKGIADLVVPSANNSIMYTTISAAQEFYRIPNGITSISIMLHDPDKIAATVEELRKIDPEGLEVMTWDEMLPEVVQGIESDNISGLFMLGILYLVVGFGILGTIIMMTMERRKEFGIMIAVGMKRTKLALILFIETLIISIMGISVGVIASLPLIGWFVHNPIPLHGEAAEMMLEFNSDPYMFFLMEPGFYINQCATVLVMAVLASVYPVNYIEKLKITRAIKGK
jgi:ABC-type lipoprotein release transport system permease subunit